MDKLDAGFKGSQKRAESFATATANIGKTAQAAGRSAEGAAKKTNKFVASIARIAKYRLIRSLIRGITDAIKQGADWFYNFSKASGEGLVGFAAAMDSVKASGNTLKAQLGAAFGTLYANIAPILNSLIGLAIKFANVITMVFAKLSGASGWYRAASAADALADSVGGAGSAAKEALRYLAPFDELNRLPADNGSGGGGGGGASNSGGASYEWVDFEQYDIGQGIADIVSHITEAFNNASDWFASVDWQGIGADLYNKFDETFSNVDWDGLAKSIFRLIGSAIGAAVGTVAGFVEEAVGDIFGYFSQYIADKNGDGQTTGAEFIGGILTGIGNAVSDLYDWFATNVFDPLYQGFMDAFVGGGTGESLSDILRGAFNDLFVGGGILLDGFRDSWTLTKAYFSDNIVRGIQQFGIDAVNGFKAKWEEGINALVQAYNNSFLADLFGEMDEIEVKMIPDLDPPVGTFFNQTKADIEAKAKKTPVSVTSKANLTGYDKAELKTPVISSKANFTSYSRNFSSGTATSSGLTPMISAKANFTSYGRNFASGTTTSSGYTPLISSKANLTSYSRAFTSGAGSGGTVPELPSKSILKTFQNSLGVPSVKSQANLASSVVDKTIADGQGRLKVSTLAKITSVDSSSVGTIQLTAKARVTGYTEEIKASGGVFSGGSWRNISRYAGGGLPNGSQLFWAREAGPELVGTLGGHTAVMNNDQIVASVSAGVARAIASIRFRLNGMPTSSGGGDMEGALYNAFVRAMNDTDNDRPIVLDGDVVYQKMVQRNRRETFRAGVNPMMA